MALLYWDGFPYQTSDFLKRWTYRTDPSQVLIAANGRFGGRYLSLTNGHGCGKDFPAVANTIMAQFGFKATVWGNNQVLVGFADGGTWQVYITGTNGTLNVYRGNGTLLASFPGVVPGVTWVQMEVKVLIHASAGTILVKMNGTTIINMTGQVTQNTGAAQVTRIGMGGSGGVGGVSTEYSDFIIMDTTGSYCNDLLGIRIVKPCVPTGVGNYAQWTPSTGANWQCVDEIPPNDDTDYNGSSEPNKIDSFPVTQLPAGAAVSAVGCSMYCMGNAPATVKGFARSAGDDGLSVNGGAVPASYNWVQQPIYVNPDTGQPFTGAEFNAAEFGYKREA